jgi:hypothetical protein
MPVGVAGGVTGGVTVYVTGGTAMVCHAERW